MWRRSGTTLRDCRGDSEILRRLIYARRLRQHDAGTERGGNVGAEANDAQRIFASLLREFRSLLSESVQSLESALTRRVENIASIILPAHATEAAHQFQKSRKASSPSAQANQ
jgi:hypothetical protein